VNRNEVSRNDQRCIGTFGSENCRHLVFDRGQHHLRIASMRQTSLLGDHSDRGCAVDRRPAGRQLTFVGIGECAHHSVTGG
jgi:hypothetical protein